jgi:flagellar M-ring protein FliF
MADNPVLDRVSGFAAQPVTRQVSLLAGFAASIALAIGVVNWAMTPSYEPVYGAMSPADNATAINVLQTSGITYRMEPGTGLLEVPYDDVLQARMALASEGFPRNGGGIGFESLYEEQQMGLSSFMEQARYHRAVEAELARTISAMNSVSGARVHLAIAKQSAFMRRGNEPSASVMVSLLPGVRLSERQLSGIIHLVASSIPNLDSDRVSVVDQAGKLLSSQGEDSDFGYTAEQFRLAQQFENSLNDRIMAILEPILGVGAVRAQVTADMDFTRIESTNEIYDPSTVLRSEQTTQDITNRGAGAGQAPGDLVNQPPQQGALAVAQDPAGPADAIPDRESTKETRNYEVNKTISHTRRVPGTIQKLSVAVVVDYVLDDNGDRIALDQARIDQVTALVREAIGFSAERGDTVQVINSPFIAPAPIEPIPEPGLLEQAWVWEIGRGLLAALAVLVLIFTVLRPMIRYSTSYTPPAAPQTDLRLENAMAEATSAGQPPALSAPSDVAPPPKRNYQQSVAMARNTAVEQPVRAAYVVKNWIAADG